MSLHDELLNKNNAGNTPAFALNLIERTADWFAERPGWRSAPRPSAISYKTNQQLQPATCEGVLGAPIAHGQVLEPAPTRPWDVKPPGVL
jgi:hypothetical protein